MQMGEELVALGMTAYNVSNEAMVRQGLLVKMRPLIF